MTSPEGCNHDARAFRDGNFTIGGIASVKCLSCKDIIATGKVAKGMKKRGDIEFLWNSVEGRYVER